MVKKQKNILLGTTLKLDAQKQGCLFKFHYRAAGAHDPTPFIIMTGPRWKSKSGKTYFSGVNLKTLRPASRRKIIRKFGYLPVGSVSYQDIKAEIDDDPACCMRTYNVRNVRALHIVGVALPL